MRIIAIDPGASGAVVVVESERPGVANWYRMPKTVDGYYRILRTIKTPGCIGVVEFQNGCFGRNVAGLYQFRFGMCYGAWLAVLAAEGIQTHTPAPAKWMNALNLGKRGLTRAPDSATHEQKQEIRRANSKLKTQWKQKLADAARELYPDVNVILENADALLIAEYARRFLAD